MATPLGFELMSMCTISKKIRQPQGQFIRQYLFRLENSSVTKIVEDCVTLWTFVDMIGKWP